MRTESIPEQDRGLQAMSKWRITAMWKIFWMVLGIAAALVLLYLDILYSAEGMIPIFGSDEVSLYLSWAASIIMSPIELAGTAVMTDKHQRKQLSNDARYAIIVITVMVFVADIVTNWMGMYNRAAADGVVTTFNYAVIGLVGTALAGMEYVIESFVSTLSKEFANFKQAHAWLQRWHEANDDDGDSPRRSGPSRSFSGPSFGGPERSPMAAGSDGPRRPMSRPDRGSSPRGRMA